MILRAQCLLSDLRHIFPRHIIFGERGVEAEVVDQAAKSLEERTIERGTIRPYFCTATESLRMSPSTEPVVGWRRWKSAFASHSF